jgi:hypothetical protein
MNRENLKQKLKTNGWQSRLKNALLGLLSCLKNKKNNHLGG